MHEVASKERGTRREITRIVVQISAGIDVDFYSVQAGK